MHQPLCFLATLLISTPEMVVEEEVSDAQVRTKTGEPHLMCCFLNNNSIYSIAHKM